MRKVGGLWVTKHPAVRLRNLPVTSLTATTTMDDIKKALDQVVSGLSDQNYTESFEFYRFWFDIGQTYHQVPPNLILDTIWKNRTTSSIDPRAGKLVHSTAHLILRLASDAESDHLLAPHSSGLQGRLSSRTLREFFANNLRVMRSENRPIEYFYAEANLVAHWANLGYVEEAAIRDHILQSLISHPKKLYDHQADALIILFKLAGATFEAYADTSVVDRCIELLLGHRYDPPFSSSYSIYYQSEDNYFLVKKELIQVCAPGKEWEATARLKQIFRR